MQKEIIQEKFTWTNQCFVRSNCIAISHGWAKLTEYLFTNNLYNCFNKNMYSERPLSRSRPRLQSTTKQMASLITWYNFVKTGGAWKGLANKSSNYRQDHNDKPMQKGAGSLETWGAYHLARKSGNFGLKSNGKVIFRKFCSEIVEYLQRYGCLENPNSE